MQIRAVYKKEVNVHNNDWWKPIQEREWMKCFMNRQCQNVTVVVVYVVILMVAYNYFIIDFYY
jgi:hypothetical protein